MKKIKILIADDHKMFREGLIECLRANQNYKIIGEAVDGVEAVELCHKLNPDIVIMDINMPKMNGLQATKKISVDCPDSKIIILSAYNEEEYVSEFLHSGAKGYLLKYGSIKEIISAIEKVMAGDIYIDNSITKQIYQKATGFNHEEKFVNERCLTKREKEILILVADGKLNKEIADCLDISIKTVIAHRENIKEKLGLRSVAELTRYAIKMGYIDLKKN
ncbi:MAG TPA: response regulator transcription factor [Bacteroidota bacterium]|nr:response regulator transcription factor [Bacteroidota bacterium]